MSDGQQAAVEQFCQVVADLLVRLTSAEQSDTAGQSQATA